MNAQTSGLLQGTRVLDLGVWRPVPYATQLLADMGATVVKVEPPGGDPLRGFPDLYRSLNARKHVTECDLKDPSGSRRVLDLAVQTDVVVEGFRPGVVDRLGVGYTAVHGVNPSVVYCSVSGFGQSGPLADVPGHDLNYQAWSGVLGERAPEVTRPGVPVADLAAGAFAALAICAALAARARTGEGEYIDVGMADVLATWAAPGTRAGVPTAAERPLRYPAYGSFECADGRWVTLGVLTEDGFWRNLCSTLGLDDIADIDLATRTSEAETLRARLAGAVATRGRDDLVADLLAADVPVAPVLDRQEATAIGHFVEHGVTAPEGETVAVGHPVRFRSHSTLPARMADPARLGPGEDFESLC